MNEHDPIKCDSWEAAARTLVRMLDMALVGVLERDNPPPQVHLHARDERDIEIVGYWTLIWRVMTKEHVDGQCAECDRVATWVRSRPWFK